ncbi:hypothetical protein EVAR_63881_1 [Eumeta japonica]|uniref:Uncharacterized protein n=1 Tax=Eumeta variegata TaxID=151549 RepID=A0A4C2A0F4_EUMVA|nr:hypothetical protein EVAR_63881_1 [Eumeta japonica]
MRVGSHAAVAYLEHVLRYRNLSHLMGVHSNYQRYRERRLRRPISTDSPRRSGSLHLLPLSGAVRPALIRVTDKLVGNCAAPGASDFCYTSPYPIPFWLGGAVSTVSNYRWNRAVTMPRSDGLISFPRHITRGGTITVAFVDYRYRSRSGSDLDVILDSDPYATLVIDPDFASGHDSDMFAEM